MMVLGKADPSRHGTHFALCAGGKRQYKADTDVYLAKLRARKEEISLVHCRPLRGLQAVYRMGDMPVWKGLCEWSMKFQGDGTGQSRERRPMSEEDQRW